MNDVIDQLFKRKSVRVFETREVDTETKKLILLSACQAPTAGNQQLYSIIDVTDRSLKEKLAKTCDNQPFIAQAPIVLIFCADAKKWYDAYTSQGLSPRLPGVGDLMLAVSDAVIAAQNAVVAAHSLGLGSCYIGDIMEQYEAHCELLNLPKYVFPAAMLVMGYPTKQQKEREKPTRCEPKYIIHENGYKALSEQELKDMLKHKASKTDYYEWLDAFCKRKYDSDFSKEMSRSVEKYIEDFTKY